MLSQKEVFPQNGTQNESVFGNEKMKKFSGVGRGLCIQPSSSEPEVGRTSPTMTEESTSSGPPKLLSDKEEDFDSDNKTSIHSSASPGESAEHDCEKPDKTVDSTKETTSSNLETNVTKPESTPELDKPDSVVPPQLVTPVGAKNAEVSTQDNASECEKSILTPELPKQESQKCASPVVKASEEKADDKMPDDVLSANPEVCTKPLTDETAKDCDMDSGKGKTDARDDNSAAEKSKSQIAANLSTTNTTTKTDNPLLSSPPKPLGAGILGPAPTGPLLPRGPPPMFPKALPISIPPPPLDIRMPPPKIFPKTKEELLQILTEQVGIVQPPDDKGAGDQVRGNTAPSGQKDDSKSKQPVKKQQYPQRQQQQQQHQQQSGQPWQNNAGRENKWRPKGDAKAQTTPVKGQITPVKGPNTTPNSRLQQQGMPNTQNRHPNTAGKKPSPQGQTKPGLSNLTRDELEKEYQWQKFSIERKIKKVLKSLKTSSDEDVVKDLLAVIKLTPSKLANFPWPKEQYVVLEKLIEHAIQNTDNEQGLPRRVAIIINSLQDMHPQGFKEDFKNAIIHQQTEFVQGSSSEFRRKQARSAGHFLGELYSLSRTSSTEFKASVQSVVSLTLKDWIKAPKVTTINDDNKLLLEVYAECLEEFLILALRDDDENLKKQVSSWLKEEILSTTRPKEAKTLLIDTIFKLACHRCTAGVPAHVQKDQLTPENKEMNRSSSSSDPSSGKMNSSLPQPKAESISPPKPIPQLDANLHAPQTPQQQQQQSQQHPHLPGSKFMSPPPSGLTQGPPRPPSVPINFPPPGSVDMSVPPPNMGQKTGQNLPPWPVASQGLPMQGSLPASATSRGVVIQSQMQQQPQIRYIPHSNPASMQTHQGSVSLPQTQIAKDGSQRHTHGVGATLQMIQQSQYPETQAMPPQQALGNMVPQVSGMSGSTNIASMMHSNNQANAQMMSNLPAQQMVQTGNVQAMQFSSAANSIGHPAQSSSQFFQNSPMLQAAQQMNSSINYQQQHELVNQMGNMVLSGSQSWQQSGVGVTQAVTAPIFSTPQGIDLTGNRQEMLNASQGNPSVQSAVRDMSSHAFAQSAVSGRFVQNSMTEAAPSRQSLPQNTESIKHGVSQWGAAPQGSAWPDKLPDSNQPPTLSPSSFRPLDQTNAQWPPDGRNLKSPETANDPTSNPVQESSGWGHSSPGPQESSQQRLGTDGWGTSVPGQGVSGWGSDPQPIDSWNGQAKSFAGHSSVGYQANIAQQNSADPMEMGPQGFPDQQRKSNHNTGPSNIKTPSKDEYVFEETASSGGGYPIQNAYTLPSKHKEGSPAAEGVAYNAMAELGSYDIEPGNSYAGSLYTGGYSHIRDGGGYGDTLHTSGPKVGNYMPMPENRSPQNSASPDQSETNAIKKCFQDDGDYSPIELKAMSTLRHRQEHGRHDWSQFETSKEKRMPSALPARNANSRRGHGRGSLRITNPCTAMPPFPAAHPPGSMQHPNKYSSEN